MTLSEIEATLDEFLEVSSSPTFAPMAYQERLESCRFALRHQTRGKIRARLDHARESIEASRELIKERNLIGARSLIRSAAEDIRLEIFDLRN